MICLVEAAGWPLNTAQPETSIWVFSVQGLCEWHRKGLTWLLRWLRLAGSLTGKLDHISATAAKQHLHHGEPDTPLCNRNSECTNTSTPQATTSTVCVLNVYYLSCWGNSFIPHRQTSETTSGLKQKKKKQVASRFLCFVDPFIHTDLLLCGLTVICDKLFAQASYHVVFQGRITHMYSVCVCLQYSVAAVLGDFLSLVRCEHVSAQGITYSVSHISASAGLSTQPLWLRCSIACQRTRAHSFIVWFRNKGKQNRCEIKHYFLIKIVLYINMTIICCHLTGVSPGGVLPTMWTI